MDKWEKQHRAELAKIEKRIKAIYEAAAQEAAAIGVTIDGLTDELFRFSRFPLTHKRIDDLLQTLHDRLQTAIINGVESQWTLANNKNNELCRVVFGDNIGKLTKEQYKRYFSDNDAARDAFLARKEAGLGLSDRVWNYTDMFKTEIEMGLDVGIRDGLPADVMARELKSYLQYPDKLFRRVRNEHGQLVLSQAAKAFHPGQGVYRSSFMNARRLAVTETNMAYRTADYERWQQLDFVVGIEVHLSGNHTAKGHKGVFIDICDELQGKYPKDFKFVGWHPFCRCYSTSILKTPAEMERDEERILQGIEPSNGILSKNSVLSPPENFYEWFSKNEQRLERATSLPYFMKLNKKFILPHYINLQGKKAIPIGTKDWLAALRRRDIARPEFGTILDIDNLKTWEDMEPYIKELSRLAKKNGYDLALTDAETALANESKVIGRSVLRTHYERVFRYEYGLPIVEMPKEIRNIHDIEVLFARISKALPEQHKWFEHGELDLVEAISFKVNGETNMRGQIGLRTDVMEKVKKGLDKIVNGRTITYEEDEAISTLWHEITHNRNKVGNVLLNDKQEFFMELSNELVARHTRNEFFKAFGYKNIHPQLDVTRSNTAYESRVHNFEFIMREASIDIGKVFPKVQKGLFEKSYTEQESVLRKVMNSTLRKKDGSKLSEWEIDRIIEKLYMEDKNFSEEDFRILLKAFNVLA